MEKFIQTIPTEEAENIVKADFRQWQQKRLTGEVDPYGSAPRLLKVGELGIYDIVVRAECKKVPNYQLMRFDEVWEFDGGYDCGGSCDRRGGFPSVQAVIDYGVSRANAKYIEFEKQMQKK